MIDTDYFNELYIVDKNIENLEVGDLVTTVLGEYGVIVGFGKHPESESDKTEYCYILMNEHVYHYLTASVRKVKKEIDK